MSEFAESFVAVRYLLGARRAELQRGLEREPYASARPLAVALGHLDQQSRARALATPLRALVTALEARYVRG